MQSLPTTPKHPATSLAGRVVFHTSAAVMGRGAFYTQRVHSEYSLSASRYASESACASFAKRVKSLRSHATRSARARSSMLGGVSSLSIRVPFARVLPEASIPSKPAVSAAASAVGGGPGWASLEGLQVLASQAFTFAPVQLVIQRVIRWSFLIKAVMEQIELRLLCRLDAPSVVPSEAIARLRSYREAVRFCWQHKRARNMTKARLAEEAGLYAPHVSCYLADDCRKRDLPGSCIKAFEWVCGNTAVSQWLALQAQLTVSEESIADKAARRGEMESA